MRRAYLFVGCAVCCGCSSSVQPNSVPSDRGSVDGSVMDAELSDRTQDQLPSWFDGAQGDQLSDVVWLDSSLPHRLCVMGCDDLEACTRDRCLGSGQDAYCVNEPIVPCVGCQTDAACDDGNPRTVDTCNPATRYCAHQEPGNCASLSGPDCNDGDVCTIDNCFGDGVCRASARGSWCCHYDETCDDSDPCTVDRCNVAENTCAFEPVPGCASCVDRDGDGASSAECGGTDCDDLDRLLSPLLDEICNDGRDNNCNDLADSRDPQCQPSNVMCSSPISLVSGNPINAHVPTGSTDGLCASASVYYRLVINEVSDVDLTLTILDPPRSDLPIGYSYGLFLRPQCGSDLVPGSTARCDRFVRGGLPLYPRRLDVFRLPTGSYIVEVQAASGLFRQGSEPVPFMLQANVRPSLQAVCEGIPTLAPSVPYRGSTTSATDAFTDSCDALVQRFREGLQQITLTEPRLVHLTTRSDERFRYSLHSTCDTGGPVLACGFGFPRPACGNYTTHDVLLESGTTILVVEPQTPNDSEYEVEYQTEPPNARCEGAPSLDATVTDSTAGGRSAFFDSSVCGSNAAPDRVYRLRVDRPQRTVLDLVASYARPSLRVLVSCSGAMLGPRSGTRFDQVLEPGDYMVVVDGETATDAGDFVLSVVQSEP